MYLWFTQEKWGAQPHCPPPGISAVKGPVMTPMDSWDCVDRLDDARVLWEQRLREPLKLPAPCGLPVLSLLPSMARGPPLLTSSCGLAMDTPWVVPKQG